MAASLSIDCEPKIKEIPPSCASAIAIRSSDTACMIAETIGMLAYSADSSPFVYLTIGVRRLTFAGMHSAEEYPGTSRYSLKVCEGSLK